MAYDKHKIKPFNQDLVELEVFEINKNGHFTPLDSNTFKPFRKQPDKEKQDFDNDSIDEQNIQNHNIKNLSTQNLIRNMKTEGIINEQIVVEEFSQYPSSDSDHADSDHSEPLYTDINEESKAEKTNNAEISNIETSNIEKQSIINVQSFEEQQEEQQENVLDSKTKTKVNKDVIQENISQGITTEPHGKMKTSNDYSYIYEDETKKSTASLNDETFVKKETSKKETSKKETSKKETSQEHNKLFIRIKPDKVYKMFNVDQLLKDKIHLENKFAALFNEFQKEDISFATPIINPQKRALYLEKMDSSIEQCHQKLLSIIESGEEVQVDTILNIMIYYAQNLRYYEGLKLLLLFDLEALEKDIFYVLLGDCYHNTGETKNALSAYNKALDINDLCNSAYFSLAFLHFEQKQYDEALNCSYKAQEYKNLNKNALTLLEANALKETNESEQALAKYCEYLKNSAVDEVYIHKYILLNISDILYNINLFEKAIIYYTKVKEENDEQDNSMSIRATQEEKDKIDYRLAICYFMSNLYGLCLKSLSRFINPKILKDDKEKDVKKISRETTNAELMSDILYGFKDAFNNGVYDKNICIIFKKLLTDLNLSVLDFVKDKLKTDNVLEQAVLMSLADIAIQSKNFKLASSFLKKILKDNPNNLEALLRISKIYYDYEHDKEKACKVFIYLEKHKSTDVFVDNHLGKYYFAKKEYEKSMQALSRCIQNGEYDFETLLYLGKSLYALGQENKALNYLKKAYLFEDDKNQEEIADILTLLGKIYLNKGEYKKGIDVLKKALTINDTLTECHQTLTSIYKKILEEKQEEHYSKYIDLEVKDKNDT